MRVKLSSPNEKDILTPATAGMNLKDFMINEVSQSQKTKTSCLYSHEGPRVVKSTEMGGQVGVTYRWLGEGWERLCNLRLQFWKMTRVWRWMVVVPAQRECNQYHPTVH